MTLRTPAARGAALPPRTASAAHLGEEPATGGAEAFRLLDNAPSAFMAFDRQWRFAYINPAGARLLGREPADLLGRVVWDEFPDAVGGQLWKAHSVAMDEQVAAVAEEYYAPLGRWFEVESYPIESGIGVHFRDTTERRRSAEALIRSELDLARAEDRVRTADMARVTQARLQSTFAAMIEGITVQTCTGEIIDANAAAEEILGLTRDQLLGRASLDPEWQSVHEDGLPFPGIDHPAMVTLRTGQPIRGQIMGVQAPGRGTRWITINSQPVPNDGSEGSAAVVTTFVDITERRMLDARLASESLRFRSFLRVASDGVHIHNSEGLLIEGSDSFFEMLGYRREELIGRTARVWDAKLTDAELQSVNESLFMATSRRFETVHRRRDGSTFPVEIHVESFELEGERYLFCASRDITESRALEQALLEVTTSEQVKIGRDLHDGLGQELFTVSLLATSALSTVSPDDTVTRDKLTRLSTLTSQAIKNCRAIAHGLCPLSFTSAGLVGVLNELVELQRESFAMEASLEFTERAPLKLPMEAQDHLHRICQEAIVNARRHGGASAVAIRLDVTRDTVRVEITDNGTGFAPSARAGAGMGLRIMAFRVTLLGGRLTTGNGAHGGGRIAVSCPNAAG